MTKPAQAVKPAAFEALWRRCVPSQRESAPRVREELLRLYSEPARRFHNTAHIQECLRHVNQVRALLREPDAVELAIWFHDAIYTPGAHDNEERSVELFRTLASGAPAAFAKRVCAMIRATKHVADAHSGDCGFVVDIDLAGFGASWDEFMRHGDELREEYAHQTDDDYYRGQVVFLARLQQRRHLYSTPFFRERYETIAQQNLSRLVNLRREQGYALAH